MVTMQMFIQMVNIHCISSYWKMYEEGRQWNCAEDKGEPKWPIRMVLIWAKVTEADIPPGFVSGSVDPVQTALQLGPPLFLEGASGRHFPGSSLKADWKRPDER